MKARTLAVCSVLSSDAQRCERASDTPVALTTSGKSQPHLFLIRGTGCRSAGRRTGTHRRLNGGRQMRAVRRRDGRRRTHAVRRRLNPGRLSDGPGCAHCHRATDGRRRTDCRCHADRRRCVETRRRSRGLIHHIHGRGRNIDRMLVIVCPAIQRTLPVPVFFRHPVLLWGRLSDGGRLGSRRLRSA